MYLKTLKLLDSPSRALALPQLPGGTCSTPQSPRAQQPRGFTETAMVSRGGPEAGSGVGVGWPVWAQRRPPWGVIRSRVIIHPLSEFFAELPRGSPLAPRHPSATT